MAILVTPTAFLRTTVKVYVEILPHIKMNICYKVNNAVINSSHLCLKSEMTTKTSTRSSTFALDPVFFCLHYSYRVVSFVCSMHIRYSGICLGSP